MGKLIKTIEIPLPWMKEPIKIPDIFGLIGIGVALLIAGDFVGLSPASTSIAHLLGWTLVAIAVLAILYRYLKGKP